MLVLFLLFVLFYSELMYAQQMADKRIYAPQRADSVIIRCFKTLTNIKDSYV